MMILSLILSVGLAAQAGKPDAFSDEQWGLFNDAAKKALHPVDLNPVNRTFVQAVSGMDIQKPKDLKKSPKKVIVAVLDTGMDPWHPDLKNVVLRKDSECKALRKYDKCVKDKNKAECDKEWFNLENPEVDLDKNGYPMDCTGWSVTSQDRQADNPLKILGSPVMEDLQGHGTHVAGIIGAEADNGIGIAGVSSNVSILPVHVLNEAPRSPVKPLQFPGKNPPPPTDFNPSEQGKEQFRKSMGDFMARAVIYAVNSGAQVINFSLGWPSGFDSEYLRAIIAKAQEKGVIFVAAAGNDSTRALLRPCSYPGVICVGSHNPDGSLSHFSNYGSSVSIAAPGMHILSTYPRNNVRPINFRKGEPYDFLSGTSQASPFVAGIVAEMLAQGIPANEVYPRLVLGARPFGEKLPLRIGVQGHLQDQEDRDNSVERKWILSGIANLSRSLDTKNLTPRPLILPLNKEKTYISWDRKSKFLTVQVPFKNYWKEVEASKVILRATVQKPNPKAIRPSISSFQLQDRSGIWKNGEVRNVKMTLEINDSSNPANTRMSSDLDIDVAVELPTGPQPLKTVFEAEVIIPITDKIAASETTELFNVQMPPGRVDLISVDQNLDGDLRTDYLGIGSLSPSPSGETGNKYYLMKQNSQGAYAPAGELPVKLEGEDADSTREQITARLRWSENQKEPGYVLGVLIDRMKQEKDSQLDLYFLNSDFSLAKTFHITNEKVKIPLSVAWMDYNQMKVPAWVDIGLDVNKPLSAMEIEENPNGDEAPRTRFYFVNDQGKIGMIDEFDGYQFADILAPTPDQAQAGIVPVLLAKNMGTQIKRSDLNEFAVAEVTNGQVQNLKALNFKDHGIDYNNLLTTRKDDLQNLQRSVKATLRQIDYDGVLDRKLVQVKKRIYTLRDGVARESRHQRREIQAGSFWFRPGPERSMRLTSLLRSSQGMKLYDSYLQPARGYVDGVLQVRMGFWGETGVSAFAFTNTEIQYHDLSLKQQMARSFERYTFIPSIAFSEFHFPITIGNDLKPGWQEPGLVTPEGSRINPGLKIKTVVRDERQNLVEIASPAKMRFQSGEGCKSLDQATFFSDGTRAMDYFCGDRIIRMKLSY